MWCDYHMFGSSNFCNKSPSWFLKILKLPSFYSGNFRIFENALGQIALPNIWSLVPIDLANKLYHRKILDFILCCLLLKIPCFIKKFCKQTCLIKFNEIASTLTCGLSSLTIFDENKFYEIKRKTFNSASLWLRLYEKGKDD